jgi:hypothetical protein
MSFFSYKNANAEQCPGSIVGSALSGLTEKICVQVKNVFDACLQQEQLDDVEITVSDIVPLVPDPENGCQSNGRPCSCNVCGCKARCTCGVNGILTFPEAVEAARNSPDPLPPPVGQWTFVSCRSSTTCGRIHDLTIDRLVDRPQFARVKATVDIPIDVIFVDARCQEFIGRGKLSVDKDVLLSIPEESIVPFTLESMVSAICVSGDYIGNCKFEITICVTVALKILAEVDLMIPTFGFCEIPPCEEFAENVCDEFFSLPLFPRRNCANMLSGATPICNTPTNNTGVMGATTCATVAGVSTCSNCGTSVGGVSSLCPRCGRSMTSNF